MYLTSFIANRPAYRLSDKVDHVRFTNILLSKKSLINSHNNVEMFLNE